MLSKTTNPETDREKLALLHEIVNNHQHQRTSCSDSNPCNSYTTAGRGGTARCDVCLALAAIKGQIPLEDVFLSVERTIYITRPSED